MKIFVLGLVLSLFTAHAIEISSGVNFATDKHGQVPKGPAKKSHHKHRSVKHSHKAQKQSRSSGQPSVHEIQHEVEDMVSRVHRLNDPETTAQFAKELGGIEAALAKRGEGDQQLMKEIVVVRAQMCEDAGFERTEYDDCEEFMFTQCSPDAQGSSEPVVSQAHCASFFAVEDHKGESHGAMKASQEPTSYTAPEGSILNGKGLRPLPDQGYTGPMVQHKDAETFSGDWRLEFGPKAGHRSPKDICAEFEGNEWCRIHGYFKDGREHKMFSGAPAFKRLSLVTVLLIVGTWWQQ